MKKFNKIKLEFEKEVISNLNGDNLNEVKGGVTNPTTILSNPPPVTMSVCDYCIDPTQSQPPNCVILPRTQSPTECFPGTRVCNIPSETELVVCETNGCVSVYTIECNE